MSNLIDGNKLLAKIQKRRADINEVIDYFDVADFELKWIEKYIIKEMETNNDSEIIKIAKEIAEMSDEEFERKCEIAEKMLSRSKGNDSNLKY